MTTEHRQAPRRRIESIERAGSWGNVKYRHLLECGHTESRPRAATVPKLACAWCLRVEKQQTQLLALGTGGRVSENIDEEVVEQLETQAKIKAEISKRLGLTSEAVDVTMSELLGLRVATVFLSRDDVDRMTGQ